MVQLIRFWPDHYIFQGKSKIPYYKKQVINKNARVIIKTHGSELRGQEEAACTCVFWPTRPLQ